MEIDTLEDMYDAIFHLKVRGAPAIGIFAAYGIYCLSQKIVDQEYDAFYEAFTGYMKYLESSRPTAVNLSWALERMRPVSYTHLLCTMQRFHSTLWDLMRFFTQNRTVNIKK